MNKIKLHCLENESYISHNQIQHYLFWRHYFRNMPYCLSKSYNCPINVTLIVLSIILGREHYSFFTLFGNFIHSSTWYSTNYSTWYEKNTTTSALVRSIRWKTKPKHWNPGTYISKIHDHCRTFLRVLQLYHMVNLK